MDDSSSPLEGFASILRLSGYNVPARARFVGGSVFSGIYTATTCGLVCGQLGVMFTPIGPLVPFLFGSGAGFCLGLYSNWKHCLDRVRIYARSYPQILAHALWTESRIIVPADVLEASKNNIYTSQVAATPSDRFVSSSSPNMEDWVQNQGLRHLSMCMLAAQACTEAVEEVDKLERQRLIESTALSLADSNSED